MSIIKAQENNSFLKKHMRDQVTHWLDREKSDFDDFIRQANAKKTARHMRITAL